MSRDTDLIIKTCVDLAHYLLTEFDEFYPFCYGITNNDKIIDISSYIANEHPTSVEVIEQLKKAILVSNIDNSFKVVAICTDVTHNFDTYKTDALRILIGLPNSIYSKVFIVPYSKQIDKGYVIGTITEIEDENENLLD